MIEARLTSVNRVQNQPQRERERERGGLMEREVRPVLILEKFRANSSAGGNVQTNICILRYRPHLCRHLSLIYQVLT